MLIRLAPCTTDFVAYSEFVVQSGPFFLFYSVSDSYLEVKFSLIVALACSFIVLIVDDPY